MNKEEIVLSGRKGTCYFPKGRFLTGKFLTILYCNDGDQLEKIWIDLSGK